MFVKVLKQPSVALFYLLQLEILNAPPPDELPEALSRRAALGLVHELVHELLLGAVLPPEEARPVLLAYLLHGHVHLHLEGVHPQKVRDRVVLMGHDCVGRIAHADMVEFRMPQPAFRPGRAVVEMIVDVKLGIAHRGLVSAALIPKWTAGDDFQVALYIPLEGGVDKDHPREVGAVELIVLQT